MDGRAPPGIDRDGNAAEAVTLMERRQLAGKDCGSNLKAYDKSVDFERFAFIAGKAAGAPLKTLDFSSNLCQKRGVINQTRVVLRNSRIPFKLIFFRCFL